MPQRVSLSEGLGSTAQADKLALVVPRLPLLGKNRECRRGRPEFVATERWEPYESRGSRTVLR